MSQPIHERIEANTRLRCRIDGCMRTRRRIGSTCHEHALAAYRKGDPRWNYIPVPEYQGEREEVRQFLQAKRDSRLIQAGVEIIQAWLEPQPHARPAAAEIHQLHLARVDPLRVIEEVSGLWLYSFRNNSRLDGGDQLAAACGRAIYRLVPRGKRTLSYSMRRAIGSYHRETFGNLYAKIVGAIQARAEKRQQAWNAIHAERFE